MTFPKWFSASMVQTWINCPMCWYLKGTIELDREGSGPLFFGRCMSAALEELHTNYDIHRAKDTFAMNYEKLKENGNSPKPDLEHGLILLDEYEKKGVFRGAPEFKFKTEVKGLSLPVVGYMDILLEDKSGPYGIAEFKTSSQLWDQDRVNRELQGILYWCSFWNLFRKLPKPFNYVIMSTKDEPTVDIYEVEYTKEQCIETLGLLQKVFSELEFAHSEGGVFIGKCSIHKEKKTSLKIKPINPKIILL